MRNDFRIFTVSRISSLELLKETFPSREFDYESMDISFRTGREVITIKLLIDESLKQSMVEFCGEENIESCGDNKFLEFTFPSWKMVFGITCCLALVINVNA